MTDIVVRITTDSAGAVTGIQQVGDSLGNVGASAEKGAQGFASMTAGAVSMAEGLAAGATAALAMIDKVNQLGVAALRAHDTLNNLSGGNADTYLAGLSTQTGGLVDQMTLASDASFLLTRGLVSNEAELDKATHLGAELGIAFGDTAAGGIDTMNAALEKVGSKRALYGLGLDVSATMDEFNKLKATMGDDAAWKFAIFDQGGQKVAQLGDQFDKTGTAVDRLKTRISDLGSGIFERVSQGLEGLTSGVQGLAGAYAQLWLKNMDGINPQQTGYVDDKKGLSVNGQKVIPDNLYQSITDKPDAPQTMQDKIDAGKLREQTTIYESLVGTYDNVARSEDQMRAAGVAHMGTMSQEAQYARDLTLAYENQAQVRTEAATQAAADLRDSHEGAGVTMDDVRANAPTRAAAARDLMTSLEGAGKSEEDMRTAGLATMQAFQGQAAAARDTAIATENAAAAAAKEAEARKGMTVAQTLGAGSNNLAADIASGADSAIQAQHDALQKELDKKVGHGDAAGSGWAGGTSAAVDTLNPKLAKAKAHYDDLAYSIAHTKHETESQSLAFSQAGAALAKLQGASAQSGGSTGPYKVYTKGDEAAALAASDKEAKQAKDAYMIATGQATAASIKEADVQADLNSKMASGAISVSAYYKELTQMDQAAQAGTMSLQSLSKAQQAIDLAAAPQKAKLALVHSQRADQADAATDQAGDGIRTASDPMAGAKAGADKAKVSIDLAATSATDFGNKAFDAGGLAAAGFGTALTRAQDFVSYVKSNSSLVINVKTNFSGGGGVNLQGDKQ